MGGQSTVLGTWTATLWPWLVCQDALTHFKPENWMLNQDFQALWQYRHGVATNVHRFRRLQTHPLCHRHLVHSNPCRNLCNMYISMYKALKPAECC
jgi:hypothetical protein